MGIWDKNHLHLLSLVLVVSFPVMDLEHSEQKIHTVAIPKKLFSLIQTENPKYNPVQASALKFT